MKMSEKIDELATALSLAQIAFKEPKKNKDAYNYKYAPMDEVRKAVIEPLAEQGLSVSQFPISSPEGSVGVETILMHKSGQYISNEYMISPIKSAAQDIGSLLTYLRRYALLGCLGLAPEDDDGKGAMPDQDADASIKGAQLIEIASLFKQLDKDEEGFMKHLSELFKREVEDTKELTEREGRMVIIQLKQYVTATEKKQVEE